MFGSDWQATVVYVDYDGNDGVNHYELSDLDQFLDSPGNTPTAFRFVPTTDLSITKASYYVIDLKQAKLLKPLQPMMTHEFVELSAVSGFIFTIEKGQKHATLQSCRKTLNGNTPVVREFLEKKGRKNLDTLKNVGEVTLNDGK